MEICFLSSVFNVHIQVKLYVGKVFDSTPNFSNGLQNSSNDIVSRNKVFMGEIMSELQNSTFQKNQKRQLKRNNHKVTQSEITKVISKEKGYIKG